MNKTYLIGGLVVVGAVVAGMVMMKPATTPAPSTATPTTEQTMEEQAASGSMKMRHSLRELMGMGMGLKCTYTTEDAEGITYVNGNSIRTDSTVLVGTTKKSMSTLITDDTMYYWSPDEGDGMKMSIAAMSSAPAGSAAPAGAAADLDYAYDYDCSQWGVDMSMFVPPAGIAFRDYDEMMKGMQGMMQGMGTDAGMMEGMEAY